MQQSAVFRMFGKSPHFTAQGQRKKGNARKNENNEMGEEGGQEFKWKGEKKEKEGETVCRSLAYRVKYSW